MQLLAPDKVRQMSPLELEAALRSVLLKQQYTKDILQPLPAGALRTSNAPDAPYHLVTLQTPVPPTSAQVKHVCSVNELQYVICVHVNTCKLFTTNLGCTFTALACMSGGAELPQDIWAEEVGEHAVVRGTPNRQRDTPCSSLVPAPWR